MAGDTTYFALRVLFVVLITISLLTCRHHTDNSTTPILIFSGTGTSPNDVEALKTILEANHLNFSTVNSSNLNRMSESQMRAHRLMIIPGGNFIDMGNSLTPVTIAHIRNAVQHGLNYLGICAGGFLAGYSGGHYNSLNLTNGVAFGFYSAESKGISKASVAIASPDAPTLEQYWEDGPQLTGWGAVAARYPDGTPATVQGTLGSGCLILTGIHPEAPEDWRGGMKFNTPAETDNAYAIKLINAALNRIPLAHY